MATHLYLQMCLERLSVVNVVITVIFGVLSLTTVVGGTGDRLCGLYLHIGDIPGSGADAKIFISLRPHETLGPIPFAAKPYSVVSAPVNSSILGNDDLCYMQIFWRPEELGAKNWYLEQALVEVCSSNGSTRNVTFIFNLWPRANQWLIGIVSLPGVWNDWIDAGRCSALPGESNGTLYRQLSRNCAIDPSRACPFTRPYCVGDNTRPSTDICTHNTQADTSNRDNICRIYLFTSYLHGANTEGYIYFSLMPNEAIGPFYQRFTLGSVVSVELTPAILGNGPWCYLQLFWEPTTKENTQWHLGKVLVENCVDTVRHRNNTYILNNWVEPNSWLTLNITIGGEWTRWSNWSSCADPPDALPGYRQRSRNCDSTWRYCPNARLHCTGMSIETEPCTINSSTTYKGEVIESEKQKTMSTTLTTGHTYISSPTRIIADKGLANAASMPESLTTDYVTDNDTSARSKSIQSEKDTERAGDDINVYSGNKTDNDDDDNNDDRNDSNEDENGVDSFPVLAVIPACVVGGVMFIAVIVFGCILTNHKKKKRNADLAQQDDKDTISTISTSSEYSTKTDTEHYYSILDLTSDFEDASIDKFTNI